jgi:hypothetical protein
MTLNGDLHDGLLWAKRPEAPPDAGCVVGARSMQIGEGAKARLAPDFESSEVGGILHGERRKCARSDT